MNAVPSQYVFSMSSYLIQPVGVGLRVLLLLLSSGVYVCSSSSTVVSVWEFHLMGSLTSRHYVDEEPVFWTEVWRSH